MSTLTGQDAVDQALKLLAVLQPGETPNSSESSDALVVINNILDNWQIQRLQNVSVEQVSVSLTGGTQSYALSPRPYAIYACTFVSVAFGNDVAYPVKMLSAVEWNSIVDRDVQANIVKGAFYDRGLASPTLWLTPIPPGGTLIYAAWTVEAFSLFGGLGSSVTLADGYQRALIHAAALELSPQYAVPSDVLTLIQQNYEESMSAIRQLNAELLGPEPGALPPGSQTPAPPTSPSGSPGA